MGNYLHIRLYRLCLNLKTELLRKSKGTSAVWDYFGFQPDESGVVAKDETKAFLKVTIVTVMRSLTCSGIPDFRLPGFGTNWKSQIMMKQDTGLVLGVYEANNTRGEVTLSDSVRHLDADIAQKLQNVLKFAGRKLSAGECRTIYDVSPKFSSVSLTCLGKRDVGFDDLEDRDQRRENIRVAVAAAVQHLRDVGETEVVVDPCGDAEAAAEGAALSLFTFEELKTDSEKKKEKVNISCLGNSNVKWQRGIMQADGQNLARYFEESPSNRMTPTIFATKVQEQFSNSNNLKVSIHDKAWIEAQNMNAFLAVAKGSVEPPVFLEMDYHGADPSKPTLALVGKGLTFDSGGISLKPSLGMDMMKGDMSGAAVLVGALSAIDKLNIPVNIKAVTALCENMPSGGANKPGDIVFAKNGKSILVMNTDAEGRLALADAICYADTFNPYLVLDVATLTYAIMDALGAGAAGLFTNSNTMWELIHKAGQQTGDRVWRLPLFPLYTKQVTDCPIADLDNISKVGWSVAGSCTAAVFLKEFVTCANWLHMDFAGVMLNKDEVPYLPPGMSGRPTRTIVQFVENVAKSAEYNK